jgi:hypothetical protein
MSLAFKSFVLLLSIVAASGADKEKPFKAMPAASYANRQTGEKVTIAVEAFDKVEKTREAFGTLNPNQYGILPVLLVIQNDGPVTLSLENMRAEYITMSRQRVEATPAGDVPRTLGGKNPGPNPDRFPSPLPRKSNNPLSAWEIAGRAFAARMLPPGESASGFLYFQAPSRPGAKLYITGLQEASTRRELFYFEIPLGP